MIGRHIGNDTTQRRQPQAGSHLQRDPLPILHLVQGGDQHHNKRKLLVMGGALGALPVAQEPFKLSLEDEPVVAAMQPPSASRKRE